jgi:D-3-phosphoglycerate dehydrogenase
MFHVLALNNISPRGLAELPSDRYVISAEMDAPDAILVRSADLHARPVPPSVIAVGRAGAGVNNIPVAALSRRGVPVFNTPGANANAVKELTIAALVLGCRRICQAWSFAHALDTTDMNAAVEAGKKSFAGRELAGRTLGVIGLGAIGRSVANAAIGLGMEVVGFDPGLTVEGAWQLASAVRKAQSLADLLGRAEFVTVHVPLGAETRHLIDAAKLSSMRRGAILVNFAREAVVDEGAVVAALDAGRLDMYVCDFPTPATHRHPRCVTLPHLGASTEEAEENCAVMVAGQVRDFLEHGNIRNAVNFPDVAAPRPTGHRVVCVNENVPNMLGRISEVFGDAGINIHGMVNQSRAELAYTIVDLDSAVPPEALARLRSIDGVLMARSLTTPAELGPR